MNKKKNAILLILLLIITLIPIGFSAWVLTDKTDFSPEFNQALPTSTLTKEIDAATSDMYIYTSRATSGTDVVDYYLEDDLEDYKVSFPNIEGYAEYIPTGGTIPEFGNQTTYLGYNNSTLEIDHNVRFTHTESKIDYTYTNYNNRVFSTPDSYGNGTYCYYLDSSDSNSYYYYTSVTNKNNDAKTYNAKVNKWINYYYNNNSLSVTDYKTGSAVKYSGTVLSKRLYTVKLVGDVLLKSGCSLDIGAFVGCVSNTYCGPSIQGYFVVLDLNGHTLTIENGATLNAWGYIIDSKVNKNGEHIGKIINRGTIYSSYIIEDYGGGGPTTATGAHGTAPFGIYSLPYLSCKTIFEYGSSLINPCSLYANSQFNISTVSFVGTSSDSAFIQLSSGSTFMVDSYNDPEKFTNATLYTQNYRTKIEFNGDISVTTAKLTVLMNIPVIGDIKQTINMAEIGFAITPYMDVVVNSGNLTLKLLVDCLPGSTLFVNENATIIFDQLTIASSESIFAKSSKSYGGIRVPSFLPADSNTCYKGHSYSSAVLTGYSNYLKNEKILNEAGNTDARVNINGNIVVNNTAVSNTVVEYTNNIEKYILAGKINLSEKAKENLDKHIAYFNTLSTDYEIYSYVGVSDFTSNLTVAMQLISASDKSAVIRKLVSDTQYVSYTVLPLVSNGKVYNASALSSSFNSDTYYDFSDGVYVCGSNNYIRLNNDTAGDLTGSFVKITEWNKDAHYVKYNDKIYSYYRNIFLENPGSIDNGLYINDNLYNSSSKEYRKIDISNDYVKMFYSYSGVGTTDKAQYSRNRTRTKGIIGDWSAWSAWSAWSQISNSIELGTVEETTTTYTDGNVDVISYNFINSSIDYGDKNTFNEVFKLLINSRTILPSKLGYALNYSYYQIGTIKVSKQIEAMEVTSEWAIEQNNVFEDTTSESGWLSKTQTNTQKCYGYRTNSRVEEQEWNPNKNLPMYVKSYDKKIKYNSTYDIWVKA